MTRIDMARQHGHNMEVKFIDNKDAFNIGYESFIAGLEVDRPKWHYVKDGDLPKENMIDVLALVKSADGKMIPYVANYSHYSKEWHPDFDDEEIIEVIYWKEIILPKEEIK